MKGSVSALEKILIIEDDTDINHIIAHALTLEGYLCTQAFSGTEGLRYMEEEHFSLILLDLMLPGLTGEQLLPRIKGVPTIVLSARLEVESKVRLLLGGAADYITKPFDMPELLARIAVALRKSASRDPQSLLTYGDLRLDQVSRQVLAGDTPVRLTRTEYAILRILMQNAGQVIAKSVLLDRISQDTPDCMESSLKVHVSNLRRKLKESGSNCSPEAVWGIGFRLTGA